MIAEAGEQLTEAELAARYRRDPELFTLVHDRHFRDIYDGSLSWGGHFVWVTAAWTDEPPR